MHTLAALALTTLLTGSALMGAQGGDFVRLFDGRSFDNWEGDESIFRIDDGAIVGGTLAEPIPRNEFLCTTEQFGDFELRLRVRITGKGENAGVQFRSQRIPDSHRVSGYQADIGFIAAKAIARLSDVVPTDMESRYPLWGSLYDESRRRRLLAVADRSVVDRVLKREDWNDIYIKADGRRIEIRLNGETTVDFVEEEYVPVSGVICVQVHKGEPVEVRYKHIELRSLQRSRD